LPPALASSSARSAKMNGPSTWLNH
jgi:hypothetical protein